MMFLRFPRRLQVVCLLVVFWCSGFASPAEQRPRPFAPGETLTYNVTWSIFSAGRVVASLSQTGSGPDDAYEINATARSSGFVSLLLNIDNAYHATFDPNTLCSRDISKTINEGRRHKRTNIIFDTTRKVAILNETDLSTATHPVKHAENAIPGCVEDILTAFYDLRRTPMQVGDRITVPVNDGSKTNEVIVDVQQRERVQTPIGSRYAFRVEPRALGNLYKKKGRMLIWFSDDAQRLPLRIKAIMLFGTITGTLASVKEQPDIESSVH